MKYFTINRNGIILYYLTDKEDNYTLGSHNMVKIDNRIMSDGKTITLEEFNYRLTHPDEVWMEESL